jgi:hypothetical protein
MPKKGKKSAVLEHPGRVIEAIAVAAGPRRPVSEPDIRVRAYQKWEAAGKPKGDDIQFWLKAEQELKDAK